MRLPRPRFTVRRLMLAVATAAGVLGLYLYLREKAEPLSRGYVEISARHSMEVQRLEIAAAVAKDPAEKRRNAALTEHHMRLLSKYQRAAMQPWLPVAPDPPEPR